MELTMNDSVNGNRVVDLQVFVECRKTLFPRDNSQPVLDVSPQPLEVSQDHFINRSRIEPRLDTSQMCVPLGHKLSGHVDSHPVGDYKKEVIYAVTKYPFPSRSWQFFHLSFSRSRAESRKEREGSSRFPYMYEYELAMRTRRTSRATTAPPRPTENPCQRQRPLGSSSLTLLRCHRRGLRRDSG